MREDVVADAALQVVLEMDANLRLGL